MAPDCDALSWSGVRQHGVRMDAWALLVAPSPATLFERKQQIPVSAERFDHREWLLVLLAVLVLLIESWCTLQHQTELNAQLGQLGIRAVLEPQLEVHAICLWHHSRSKCDSVWQTPFRTQLPVFLKEPVPVFDHLILRVPNRRDMGVRKEDQAEVAKDGLGKIQHHISTVFPGRENGHLGATQRVDGAVKEANAGMTAPRLWHHFDPPAMFAGGGFCSQEG